MIKLLLWFLTIYVILINPFQNYYEFLYLWVKLSTLFYSQSGNRICISINSLLELPANDYFSNILICFIVDIIKVKSKFLNIFKIILFISISVFILIRLYNHGYIWVERAVHNAKSK